MPISELMSVAKGTMKFRSLCPLSRYNPRRLTISRRQNCGFSRIRIFLMSIWLVALIWNDFGEIRGLSTSLSTNLRGIDVPFIANIFHCFSTLVLDPVFTRTKTCLRRGFVHPRYTTVLTTLALIVSTRSEFL